MTEGTAIPLPTEDEDKKHKELLLEKVPSNGDSIGNKSLKEAIGWDNEKYWQTRNSLIFEGKLAKGRGKGGSVYRVLQTDANIAQPNATADETAIQQGDKKKGELALYEPILEVLRDGWAQDNFLDPGNFFAEITAKQGSRATGGKWSRPDIILACSQRFRFVPSVFELITFEVKTHEAVDVTAVYEALAHRRFAHTAYVLFHFPEEQILKSAYENLSLVRQECIKYGIGLILITGGIKDYENWDIDTEASRHAPEPEHLNDFLTKISNTSEPLNDWLLKNAKG